VKRITAFVGSAHKRSTQRAVQQFLDALSERGEVECEIVALGDYRIGTCRGCRLCFDKGEEFCPLRDDRDVLIRKIEASDGVVFASPNYSFHVSGLMKTFLDRLGFAFHRPRFFGKAFTSIVCQGFYGGKKIVKYFDFLGNGLGFNTVKGACLGTLEPMTGKAQRKIDSALAAQSRRFHERLSKPAFPAPGVIKLMLFRWSRTSIKFMRGVSTSDHSYYSDKGWFESDYYYPARLGPLKKAAGNLFDSIALRIGRNMQKETA
jgi:multimeric flavodoxin WrbA